LQTKIALLEFWKFAMNILTCLWTLIFLCVQSNCTKHDRFYRSDRITAYVITTNASDIRAIDSRRLLEGLNFQVQFIIGHFKAKMTRDVKIASIRNATMEALKAVATGTEKFAYIFEDDIGLAPDNKGRQVTAADIGSFHSEWSESNLVPSVVYAGVCLQWTKNNGNCPSLNPPDSSPPHTAYHCCGTCHHAMAYSRSGAQQLLDKINQNAPQIIPVDRLLLNWCRSSESGFWVRGWSHQSPLLDTHRGWFFQDRNKYKTVKDSNNNHTTI
jgi:hypothetical protein